MLAACSTAGVSVTSVARAESEADRATARELAAEGNDALKKKNYETAEDRFRRADALVHAPTLVVDHARSLVGLGRFAEAYERYQLVLKEGAAANAPRGWKQAVKDAEREVQPLAAKIAWLTLSVKTPGEVHVWMDGREVSAEELGTRHAVDPGTRAVTARAAGFLPKETSLTLTAGGETTLEIELEPAPPEPTPVAVAATPQVAAVAPPPAKDRTWIYVAYGVGAAGLVTGATAGVLALGVRSDIDSECPDLHCTAKTPDQLSHMQNQKSKYQTLGVVSGVGFALGVAGAATGTALLLMQNKSESGPNASARVVPYLGLGELGVTGRF
ncbi:MAG TPA: hypothetical protein VG937_33940 [Polyangiaceae bacterium]|nr:hypothetical protein [Polyangiaceae bacterium]